MKESVQIYLIHYLNKVVYHFASIDMLQAQKGKRKYGKIKPYSLSTNTLEAQDFLNFAHAGINEEEIKDYIHKLRMCQNIFFEGVK